MLQRIKISIPYFQRSHNRFSSRPKRDDPIVPRREREREKGGKRRERVRNNSRIRRTLNRPSFFLSLSICLSFSSLHPLSYCTYDEEQ